MISKGDIAQAIAEQAKLSKNDAHNALEEIMEQIGLALGRGEDISLIGFGSFQIKERAERAGRNPKTGEALTIAAHKAVHFKPGKALKDAVNS